MSFLNAALLAGMAAFLIPLVIHLLNRSRFQSVDWGAMHLLESALEVNSRSFQWESLLLLLARCFIPILLAFALARPVITSMRIAGAQGEKAMVFLIDDSLSMNALSGGQPVHQQASDACLEIIDRNRNAEKTLHTTSQATANLRQGPTLDNSRFRQWIASIEWTSGSSQLMGSMLAGLRFLSEQPNPNRHLILLSDFRKSQWQPISASDLAQIREIANGNDFPIQISLLPVGDRSLVPRNVSIHFANRQDDSVVLNQPKTIAIEVRNWESLDRDNVHVTLSVDGQDVSSRNLSLAAGGREGVQFGLQYANPEWHALRCRISAEDDLTSDNEDCMIMQVVRPHPVLLLGEDSDLRSENADRRPADFLRLALAPFVGSTVSLNRFDVHTISPAKLTPQALREFRGTIILDGVSRLTDAQSDALCEFVQAGGGLLVFAGPNLDREWYQRRLHATDHLLPMAYGEPVTRETGLKLMQEKMEIPKLDVFNNTDAGDLSTLEFHTWMPLKATDSGMSSASAENSSPLIALRFSDGSPFAILREVGGGTVVQCAAATSDAWSNLPLKPVFVPLMQQLAQVASQARWSPNLVAGQPGTLLLKNSSGPDTDPQTFVASAPSENPRIEIRRQPGNEIYQLMEWQPNDARAPILFSNSFRPGTYQNQLLESPAGVTLEPEQFAVSAQTEESDLAWLTQSELKQIADRLGASLVQSAKEFSQQAALNENGRELWRPLIVGLILLLFVELLLARFVTRGAV